MEVHYSYKAADDLKSLSVQDQHRVAQKMRFFATQRNPLTFAKHLTNPDEGEYRFRIGNLRVIFDIRGNTMYILKIAPRDKAY